MDGWSNWIGKRVYIKTRSGRVYSGTVKSVDKDIPRFLTIIDKYWKIVTFAISEVLVIQEEKGGNNDFRKI